MNKERKRWMTFLFIITGTDKKMKRDFNAWIDFSLTVTLILTILSNLWFLIATNFDWLSYSLSLFLFFCLILSLPLLLSHSLSLFFFLILSLSLSNDIRIHFVIPLSPCQCGQVKILLFLNLHLFFYVYFLFFLSLCSLHLPNTTKITNYCFFVFL